VSRLAEEITIRRRYGRQHYGQVHQAAQIGLGCVTKTGHRRPTPGAFVKHATISVSNGATLNFSNSSTTHRQRDSRHLNLGGRVTTANIGTIHRTAAPSTHRRVDKHGRTLALNSTGGYGAGPTARSRVEKPSPPTAALAQVGSTMGQ